MFFSVDMSVPHFIFLKPSGSFLENQAKEFNWNRPNKTDITIDNDIVIFFHWTFLAPFSQDSFPIFSCSSVNLRNLLITFSLHGQHL